MTSDQKVDTSHVTVHKLPPVTRRLSEDPRWEVRAQGQVIGWVEARHLGKGHTLFYFATGIHPQTGREYRWKEAQASMNGSTPSPTSTGTP